MTSKQGFTSQVMENRIAEGRGQGDGESYKPWLMTWDVPSLGRVNQIMGRTVKREYYLMSDLEECYFTILDSSENILDIKEQYPLSLI
jgi:hypothetical protein